jgi:hypothetical protein
MEPGSRTTREQRGDMRDDNTSTGGQWDDPMSKGSQGQRGELFLYQFVAFRPCVDAIPSTVVSGTLTNYPFL